MGTWNWPSQLVSSISGGGAGSGGSRMRRRSSGQVSGIGPREACFAASSAPAENVARSRGGGGADGMCARCVEPSGGRGSVGWTFARLVDGHLPASAAHEVPKKQLSVDCQLTAAFLEERAHKMRLRPANRCRGILMKSANSAGTPERIRNDPKYCAR